MLALLYWGVNFLKSKDLFTSTRDYYAVYDQVNGLQPSASIVIKGFKVGTVSTMSYDPEQSQNVVVAFADQSEIPHSERFESTHFQRRHHGRKSHRNRSGLLAGIAPAGRYALLGDQQRFPRNGRQRVRVYQTASERRHFTTDRYARQPQCDPGRQPRRTEYDGQQHGLDYRQHQ